MGWLRFIYLFPRRGQSSATRHRAGRLAVECRDGRTGNPPRSYTLEDIGGHSTSRICESSHEDEDESRSVRVMKLSHVKLMSMFKIIYNKCDETIRIPSIQRDVQSINCRAIQHKTQLYSDYDNYVTFIQIICINCDFTSTDD